MSKTKLKKTDVSESEPFIPQDQYLQSVYALTEHWQSDVKFFEDELNFFHVLIDKYLPLLIDQKNVEQTRKMVSHVLDLDKSRVLLEERIDLHAQHLADVVENRYVKRLPDYTEEHTNLEKEFSAFVKKFRAIKSEVFKITEQAIHSDKARRIIDLA